MLVLAVVNAAENYLAGNNLITSILLLLMTGAFIIVFIVVRTFPLKAQDRAIRAEENLRYFALTGKLFDKQITMHQIIALRFASNEELVALTDRTLKENLSSKAIKQAIKNWRADNHRM